MAWQIPLSDIDMGAEEIRAVTSVLESRWLTLGAITHDFEQQFAAMTGSRHAVAVTNATAALHLACVVANLGPGDEVIVPSLTFVATANAIRYVGATPVFADVTGLDNLNISPESILENLSPRTRAIIVVHYAGYACAMQDIMRIAKDHGLIVIEDAAHAAGSDLDGIGLGAWGQTGCFSFFSNKNMTTGEGGMITTQDDAIADRLRILRSHGMTSMTWDRHKGHAWSYDVTELGYNYRIDEIRAALGLVQLGKLKKNNLRRQVLTGLYRETLAELAPNVSMPFTVANGVSAYHILPVLLPSRTDRRVFMDKMKELGIQTSIHYPPIHTFQAFHDEKFPRTDLSVTDEIAAREVTLPLYPGMIDENVFQVAQAVAAACKIAQDLSAT
jgi:dTDP-4-amino-4,6-dideoxygalactose transaminase